MKKKILIVFLLIFMISTMSLTETRSQTPEPVVFIDFLVPDTVLRRIQFAELIAQSIAEIGINVTYQDVTGWSNIGPRTWTYPFSNSSYIPTYAEGGYDVLFYGWSWDLDWYETVSDLYQSGAIVPNGDNFYQYSNTTYDSLFDLYINEYDPIQRTNYAHQMQEILYDDLPSIGIVYPGKVFGQSKNISGIDYFLFFNGIPRAENWTDTYDSILKAAIPANLDAYNAFKSPNLYDELWMQTVYGGLLRRVQNTSNWEPYIAKNYTITPDLDNEVLNISVFLDPSAKFSDGNPVLPEDVKYSYELYMSDDVGSQLKLKLKEWLGDSSNITIVNNIIGGEMIFTVKATNTFPQSMLRFGIIDKSEVEPLISTHGYFIFDEDPGSTFVGWSLVKSCGPFKIYDGGAPSEGYDAINSIAHMVPNEYWNNNTVSGGQQPYLTDYYLKFIVDNNTAYNELLLGNIDVMHSQYLTDISMFEGFMDVEGVLIQINSHQEMGINMKHPVIGTGELTPEGTAEAARQIRQAISHAIPRQTIIDDVYNGSAFLGIIPTPETVSVFNKALKPYSHDLVHAKHLMENAGYVISLPEFSKFNIILIVSLCLVSIYTIRRIRK